MESRALLSGMAPWTSSDSYAVWYDALDTSAQSLPSVLSNDFDMEFDSLTAVLGTDVSHGSLSLNSSGHFVYTPDAGYSGSDSFTYQAYDGTGYSGATTVTLTVTTAFSAANNLADRPVGGGQSYGDFSVSQQTGAVLTSFEIAPGHTLLYDSTTDPHPIIAVDTESYRDANDWNSPSGIETFLTVDSITGATVFYADLHD